MRNARCRVVISDLKMPEMDGRTLLEQILQIDPAST